MLFPIGRGPRTLESQGTQKDSEDSASEGLLETGAGLGLSRTSDHELREAGQPTTRLRWGAATLLFLGSSAVVWRQFGQDSATQDATSSAPLASVQGMYEWAYTSKDVATEKCGQIEEGIDYAGGVLIEAIQDVHSIAMCCAACAAYPNCRAWTWGSNYSVPYVGGYCFVKEFGDLGLLEKKENSDVVSGFPYPGLQKHGITPAPASVIPKLDGIVPKDVGKQPKISPSCPGTIGVDGHGPVALVNANNSIVELFQNDMVITHMKARIYWGDWCVEGVRNNSQYTSIYPLGKTLRYTVDLSGTECGCNAAFYLVPMRHNTKKGTCGDYYCDAMSVCGVPCAEIDIQEANQFAWRTTLHENGDFCGDARGYSGSQASPARRDWSSAEYGPGALCVDTSHPFQVAMSFPVDETTGELAAFQLQLSQIGKPCTLSTSMTSYKWGWPPPQKNGWGALTKVLREGVTPVMSYWKSEKMLWLDGLGEDGRGPCVKDVPDRCPEYVRFYDFSIGPYVGAGI